MSTDTTPRNAPYLGPGQPPASRLLGSVLLVWVLMTPLAALAAQDEDPPAAGEPIDWGIEPEPFVPQAPPELDLTAVDAFVDEPFVTYHLEQTAEELGLEVGAAPTPASWQPA